MKQFRTRRHPIAFYFVLIFATLFLGGYGSMLTWMYCDLFINNEIEGRVHLFPLLIAAFFFMLYYTWRQLLMSVPIVVFDGQFILFNRQRYSILDISQIVFSGKFPKKFVRSYMTEGMRIEFNDGSNKILYDDDYSNLGELKCLLNLTVLKGNEQTSTLSIEQSRDSLKVGFTKSVVISRPHVLSMNGFFFYFLLCMLSLLIFHSEGDEVQISFSIIESVISLMLVLLSYTFHYFIIEESQLTVRKSLWFWKKDVFNFFEVKEIVIENAANGITILRVITKDFKSHTFPAEALRKSDWKRLEAELEKRHVSVRNDANSN